MVRIGMGQSQFEVEVVFAHDLLFNDLHLGGPEHRFRVPNAAGVELVNLVIEIPIDLIEVSLGINGHQGFELFGVKLAMGKLTQARGKIQSNPRLLRKTLRPLDGHQI